MAQIVWTRRALDDLQRLIDYISADSASIARRFVKRIIERVEHLRAMPLMGAFIAEDDRKIYREVLHGNYRVIYRIESSTVYVITVFHAARLLDSGRLS